MVPTSPHPLPPYPSNRDVPWFQIWEMKPHMGSTGLPPTPYPLPPTTTLPHPAKWNPAERDPAGGRRVSCS